MPLINSLSYGWAEDDQCAQGIGSAECAKLKVDSYGYVSRVNSTTFIAVLRFLLSYSTAIFFLSFFGNVLNHNSEDDAQGSWELGVGLGFGVRVRGDVHLRLRF